MITFDLKILISYFSKLVLQGEMCLKDYVIYRHTDGDFFKRISRPFKGLLKLTIVVPLKNFNEYES